MNLNLKDKKVALTGATGGFGLVFVKDLVEQGAIVYAIARTRSKLESLQETYPTIIPVVCDITKWSECEKILSEQLPEDLDILVNNAGILYDETIQELNENSVDDILNVNIKGTLCVTKTVTNRMIAHGKGGTVVNVSSVASDFPTPFLLVYSMSKAAINRLTKTLAVQLGPHKIRVNSVNPTVIYDTEMGSKAFEISGRQDLIKMFTPLEQLPVTQDVSNALLFLLSDKAQTITGQIMFVDSGIHGG